MANIDRPHFFCSMPEQTIGEPAGGGTEVEAYFARGVDTEFLQGVFKLYSATGNVRVVFSFNCDYGVVRNHRSGFICRLIANHDLAGHDKGLSLLTALGKASFSKKYVQPLFRHAIARGPSLF